MAAGLPGTGIGGLFFIVSAFFMLIFEVQQTLRGRSSRARWRLVGRQAGVSLLMVAAVTGSIWLVQRLLFGGDARTAPGARVDGPDLAHRVLPFSPVLIALTVLAAVLGIAYGARFVFARRRR